MFTRAVEPVIPQIAGDFKIELATAALLSSAYTFPYALVQPVLGTIGDIFGKTRLMNVALLIVSLAALICAVVTDFRLLVAMRIATGLVAGGVFPAAMALVGDLVPVQEPVEELCCQHRRKPSPISSHAGTNGRLLFRR